MWWLWVWVGLVAEVWAVPVDNGVEGDPEIECGPNSITVNFNTRNTFEGNVYVKGLYDQDDCRNTDGGRQVAGIELPFDACNTRRIRALNPKGVFVTSTVIISFHPLFLTKVDRAYRIQCFYMEADKTVDTRIEVSMLTTDFATQNVPMPDCRYEILDGGPTASPIEFAVVGQPVYHKWTCESQTQDTFCMVVRDCFVESNGERVELVNTVGCANDRYLLNNPEYLSDLMAGVEAHVFKRADVEDLYFQCQVVVLVKEPNTECPRPLCGAPPGRGAGNANPLLGPVAASVAHPYPLEPGSPYLPSGDQLGSNLRGSFNGAPPPPSGDGTRGSFVDPRGKRSVSELQPTGILDVGVELASLDMISNATSEALTEKSFFHPGMAAVQANYCFTPEIVYACSFIVILGIAVGGMLAAKLHFWSGK